jgi:hypothetical protein
MESCAHAGACPPQSAGLAPASESRRARSVAIRIRGWPTRGLQSDLQRELYFVALRALRQGLQNLDAPGKVRHRFDVGQPGHCTLTGTVPIRHRLLGKTRLGVVTRDGLGLSCGNIGKIGGERGGDARMQLFASAA